MSGFPPVSVIVPCHDAATTVVRAVESVAAQSSPPTELILVDDGSRDGTADAIAGLAGRHWPFDLKAVRLAENRGPGEARNEGIARADPATRYVAFLDADDWWLPAKLAVQVAWMERHAAVAWTAHRCLVRGDAASPAQPADVAARPITRTALLLRNFVATPTVVARMPPADRFRAGWRACEDLMLWIDWLDHGHAGAMLEAALAVLGRRPTTPGGTTGDMAAMHAGERRVLDTLAREGRLSSLAACGWKCYAAARYLRRRIRG
jgi:glycosyltransferase involved in cell wall biosynthesis